MARERQPLRTDKAFINHASWMMEDSEYKRFVQNVKRSALEKGIDKAYEEYKSSFHHIFDWGDPEQYAIHDTIYLKGLDFTAQKFFDIHIEPLRKEVNQREYVRQRETKEELQRETEQEKFIYQDNVKIDIFYVQIGKSRQLRYRDTITGRFVKQK